jgi:hypothetical protein
MRKIIFLTQMIFVLLNLTAMVANAEVEKHDKDIINVVNEFIPSNSSLISPEHPVSTKPFQLYDFNHDGNDEVIINYKLKAKEQPSPSQFGAIVLKKESNEWKKVWETKSQGVGLDYSGLADITGDGTKEYLFGVTMGASVGNKLQIFKWKNNSLKKVADVSYHMMELLSDVKDVGIVVWQRYIADTYFVNVLKWNGQKLVLDEGLYSKYYPVIERFYEDKISKMNAWFYWYTLADAQIKANLFDKAEKSIQKGISLAKQLSLTDEVENFKKLKVKLENKKKSN